MTRTADHDPLSRDQGRQLLSLCDPAPATPAPIRVAAADAGPILRAARAHGVLPVVWRRLAELNPAGAEAALAEAETDCGVLLGQSMLLAHFGKTIADGFRERGIRFAIVKGPVFAERLYPRRADRPFTDVDFLVHHDDLDRANTLMRETGFVSCDFEDRPADTYGEYKWQPADGRNVLIELHANLVHSPKLRGTISLGYETLLEAGGGDAEAPAALMLVAGLHASLGHQFERLQLLVDVLQAARHVARTSGAENVVHACRTVGAELAVATALDLASVAFREPAAGELAGKISNSKLRYAAKALVSPRVAAGAQESTASRRSWRRKFYRQMLAAHRPAGAAR